MNPTQANVALWLIAKYCIDCGGPLGPRWRFHCTSCYKQPKCPNRLEHARQWARALGEAAF